MAKGKNKTPAEQAIRPGKGGIVPPIEHQWPPGVSGNPAGRPPGAGLAMKEWLNTFCAQGLTEPDLRAIAKDKSVPWAKRAAAERALRTIEAPDLADFEDFVSGSVSLEDLRAKGIDTGVIKKVKERRQVTRSVESGKALEETVTREIELHDRAGEDFDRVSDRTDGKPAQSKTVTHQGPGGGPVEIEGRLSFDHDGFAELYRRRHAVGGEGGRAANGNGRH